MAGNYIRTLKHREKMRIIQRIIQNKPEIKAKLCVASKKKWENPEYRAKVLPYSTTAFLGKHHTPETRAIMSANKIGDKNNFFGKRHTEETKDKMRASCLGKRTGEKNPNWKGGTCNLPYPFDFDNELKELIRKRDSYICQLCGKDRKKNKKNLSVHHIDYIKENLDPKNLITLCCSCNGKVNSGRENWIKFFGLKLKIKIIYHNAVRV